MAEIKHSINGLQTFIKMSKLVCMWPAWRNGFYFRVWHTLCVIFIVTDFIYSIISFLITIFTYQNINTLATIIDFTAVTISALIRYCYVLYCGPAYKCFVTSLSQIIDDKSFRASVPNYDPNQSQARGRKYALAYYIMGMIFIVHLTASPVLDILLQKTTQLSLVYSTWQPVNMSLGYNRIIVYAQQVSISLIYAHIYLTLDSFWFFVMMSTIDQLKLIKLSLENLCTANRDIDSDYTTDVIMSNINQHIKIRRIIKDIANLTGPLMLMNFMSTITSMAFVAVDFVNELDGDDFGRKLYLLQFIVVSMSHMFIYDYLASQLVIQEDKLSDAMYDLPWHVNPIRWNNIYLMSMAAFRSPHRITGCQLFPVSLEFFVQKITTIFSYNMALIQLSRRN